MPLRQRRALRTSARLPLAPPCRTFLKSGHGQRNTAAPERPPQSPRHGLARTPTQNHALRRLASRLGTAARSPDHRTDALSSFVALGGLVGSGLGFPALDSVAGLAVAAMVTRVGVEMGYSAIQELVDSQVEPETIERVKALIGSSPDVVSTTHVRGRKLGPWLAFDLRMQVPFAVSVSAAKQIATKAKLRVLENMPEVAARLLCGRAPVLRRGCVGSGARPTACIPLRLSFMPSKRRSHPVPRPSPREAARGRVPGLWPHLTACAPLAAPLSLAGVRRRHLH